MSNEIILKEIAALAKTLADTATEGLGNKRKTVFYKEILKDIAFQVFEKAQLIEAEQQGTENIIQEPLKQAAPEPVTVVHEEPAVVPPPVAEKVTEPAEEIKAPEPVIQEIKPVTPPPVQEEKPVPVPQPQVSKSPAEEGSLYDKLSKTHQKQNLADKHTETPIKELPKAISVSKKFEFINELFNGNPESYRDILAAIESAGSYTNAVAVLEQRVFPVFDWSEQEQLASEFMSLVKRRFM